MSSEEEEDNLDDILLVKVWSDETESPLSYFIEGDEIQENLESEQDVVAIKKKRNRVPMKRPIRQEAAGKNTNRFVFPTSRISDKQLIFNHMIIGILFLTGMQVKPLIIFEMFISNSKLNILTKVNSVVLIFLLIRLNYFKTKNFVGNRITSVLVMYLSSYFVLQWSFCPLTVQQDSWSVRLVCYMAYVFTVVFTILILKTKAARRKVFLFLWRKTRDAGNIIIYHGYVKTVASPLRPNKIYVGFFWKKKSDSAAFWECNKCGMFIALRGDGQMFVPITVHQLHCPGKNKGRWTAIAASIFFFAFLLLKK